MKTIGINVTTIRNGVVCDALSVKNCSTAQLSSILSLCSTGDSISIDFVELDVDVKSMSVNH